MGRSPRERMVFSAAQLVRSRGVTATGMRDVAVHADAPRGSLGHYFPGGKEQLVNEAVGWAGRYAGRRIDRLVAEMPHPTPSGLFERMAGQWIDEFRRIGFDGGCPIAAATVDGAATSDATAAASAAAFADWRRPIVVALKQMGVPAPRAKSFATLMVSALEGALLIARSERDVAPIRAVVRELSPVLDAGRTAATPTAARQGRSTRQAHAMNTSSGGIEATPNALSLSHDS